MHQDYHAWRGKMIGQSSRVITGLDQTDQASVVLDGYMAETSRDLTVYCPFTRSSVNVSLCRHEHKSGD